ncbi:MAG: DUF4351 domain-containing protein, partial [Verrucomicrobia bacterium]|nr:DUF4351 domain-containing protein [Verrucomicrobiota bacterium]
LNTIEDQKTRSDIMNLAQKLRHDGIQQGIQIGKQQGIEIGEQRGEQRGIEIGEQRGERRGEQRGMRQGTLLANRNTLTFILTKRFGALDPQQIQTIEQATAEQLESAIEHALDAAAVEEVLGQLRTAVD